jgi:hypothetical protein
LSSITMIPEKCFQSVHRFLCQNVSIFHVLFKLEIFLLGPIGWPLMSSSIELTAVLIYQCKITTKLVRPIPKVQINCLSSLSSPDKFKVGSFYSVKCKKCRPLWHRPPLVQLIGNWQLSHRC